MGRKRKIPIADEEKENAVAKSRQRGGGGGVTASKSMLLHGPMYTIMSIVQLNETSHKKYIKELKQLYAKMDHDAFMFTFIKMIKTAMVADEGNEYAETTLLFCSKFVSSYDGDDTHPLLIDICKWLLTTISRNPHIRYRICQFVNMILKALGQEAALDDAICDRIMEYMLHRLHDTSPNVRVQAILAMQRLQVPDNPDDPVLRAYQFHLCSDPSSRVRQAVITCMGRNYHTIPYILDRLWDIDEKVRRHTYLHMSSYPVRSYKVSQRLTLLQQGLNDRSEAVRKVVVTIMLQQWIESYQKDLIALISALKLDSSESEIDRFRKVAKQTLKEIFKRQNKEDLLACVPLEKDGETHSCVPYEKLSMEIALYWQCLTEFLQAELAEEFDLIVPELSAFCIYVEKFCQLQKPDMDKFELMEFQYKLLSLMEILYTFDLGDEIGRGNLQKLLAYLLKTFRLDEKVIEVIVRCAENLITDQNARIQLFVEIIQDICGLNSKQNDLLHDRTLISELLASSSNADLNLKLSSLKVKILDLEEQEMNFVQRKDYMRAQRITEEKLATTEEYTNLLQPLLENHPNAEMLKRPLQLRKTQKPESILKSLQITFYMVVSPKVRSLNPSILKLYNDFICRHLASNQIAIRDWALKCGTACSMLYEALGKDVFEELYAQFFKNHNIRIWETSITCIFELLDRYGLDNFAKQEEQNKSKKSGRQLYNTLEFLDSEDDSNVLSAGQGVDVIYMMSHFLDTCDDTCIISAIIIGFCRLILRGYIKSSDIIEKLLLRYFNPSTDSNISQILGVFLENLIQRKKHGLLQPCLLPMLSTVLGAPYENPLHDIRPETITRFIIDSTRLESSSITDGCIHNKIALTFLQEMLNNLTNKELCKLLAKELITLELSVMQNEQLKREMKECADKLIKAEFDPKTVKHIIDFKDLVDGNYNPARKTIANDSEGEEDSNDETENDAKDDDDNATVTTARSKTSVSETVDEPTQQPPPQPPPDAISTAEETIPSSQGVAASAAKTQTATSAPAAEKPASATADGAIITKDISPTARVPTTYGRENRVGHRYLRKSLNSTRGGSDTEVGEGPPRSPKIRIEARIDSDKKSEQPAREERQVRNTRVRRNLRYADKNNAAEEEVVEMAKGVTIGRNKRRANVPTIVVDAVPERNTSPKQNLNPNSSASAPTQETLTQNVSSSAKRQSREPTKEQSSDKSLEKALEPNRGEPKEQAKLCAKEPEQVKVTPAKAIRLPVRSSARKTPRPIDADELNTSDVIPPSPPAVMSPRTVVRRQRRAGGGDISFSTLAVPTFRATRSHSAQPTPSQDSDASISSEEEVRTEPTTKATTKASKPAHTSLKRGYRSTPEPVGIASAGELAVSPLVKRLRAGTPRKTRNRTSTPELSSETAEIGEEVEEQQHTRGRPRTRSGRSAGLEKNSETVRRSTRAKLSEPNELKSVTRTSSSNRVVSETLARSASSTRSITRTDSASRSRSSTRGRSATRSATLARVHDNIDSVQSAIHIPSHSRTRSATRRVSLARAHDTAQRTRSATRTSAVTDFGRRTRSNTRSASATRAVGVSGTRSASRADLDTQNKSALCANIQTAINTDKSTLEVTQPRRSLREKPATNAAESAKDVAKPSTSKIQRQSSRIPVLASNRKLATVMKTRHAQQVSLSSLALVPKAIVSDSSSGGNSSSSTEQALKTLGEAALRRRELKTKMTRINLVKRDKGHPVPMDLARPSRLRAPVANMASTLNLRARKR
ncbi:condensin complex subunit 3 [Anastrepha ludens]|uniref:condensin complex subunit 3 n=1 Tax=Anastrepha ludens TaxID=28586 RepID=UPI0023B1D84D|nr:condensin complex subunit 3 [Anastrepha ludens]